MRLRKMSDIRLPSIMGKAGMNMTPPRNIAEFSKAKKEKGIPWG
ncbi:MAG: hypothetical protein AAFO95_20735 [Cyanobacteria bacterium J06600_6]